MFVILMNYVKPLAEIDANLEAHRRFLDKVMLRVICLRPGRACQDRGNHLAHAPGVEELRDFSKQRPIQ